jgi:acyl-CoA synthetase (AMP-forming)/AMP-acid ligase II
LPIIRPGPGSSLRVIGPGGAAPVGAAGEVVIETAGLAWGYRGASRIAAERFRPAPNGSGTRAFWTGLIGRMSGDGGIVLYGPAGRVPLVGGRWIKMDAIEFVAETVPGIERAVLELGASGAEPRLLLRARPEGAGEAAAAVHDRLRSALPGSWVPAVEALVVNADEPTGTTAGQSSWRPVPGVPPNGARDVERVVAAIWAEALEVGALEPDQDFFRAGGDSIRALRVVAQLEEIFGTEIPLVLIFKHPTLAGFAEALACGGAWSGIVLETAAALCAEAEDES